MSSADIIDLCSDDDNGEVDVKAVKLEPDLVVRSTEQNIYNKTDLDLRNKSQTHYRRQESEENRSSSALSTSQSGISVLDREQSPLADDGSLCSTLPICSAPLCRQFWKAGNYIDVPTPMSALQNGTSHLRIHPKFLHSNSTSHKWAFGAIAELLDNAVDEIQNGATFVIIDKTLNPRIGASALLIQDDGGGMDPEAMRRCLSFGFSNKKSKSTIGQYGNGFKTSSMRLGADVIVFSRHCNNRNMTQSIGLLSYTFLTQTGHDRIVVPMVDYEFNSSTGTFDNLHWQTKENYMYNLSILLQWSPYSTENELMKQFDAIGYHGTKIIIYNLWFNDENTMELDFESDPKDIYIAGEANIIEKRGLRMAATDQHIANRLRYSLRAYLSVLYLRIPESFCILLRGEVVEYHNIATDLKFPEFIKYSPHNGGCVEGTIITTIGFLKEAPLVSIHGFNVYHKNRLILPFWRTVSSANSRGRGVVGVLEANFIVPTHSKQEFEKTAIFQKLEIRLKEMTLEYWDYHCELIGYHAKKKPRVQNPSSNSSDFIARHDAHEPVVLSRSFCAAGRTQSELEGGTFLPLSAVSLVGRQGPLISSQRNLQEGACLKRKDYDRPMEPEKVIWKGAKANAIDTGSSQEVEPATSYGKRLEDKKAINLMQENKKLRARFLENEKRVEEFKNHDSAKCCGSPIPPTYWPDPKKLIYSTQKLNENSCSLVIQLRTELGEAQGEYARLLAESQFWDKVKEENRMYLL